MTRERFTDETFDQLMSTWLDERAHGPAAEPVLDAALSRTGRARPLPGWLLPERWIPTPLTTRLHPVPRLAPILLILGLLARPCRGDRACWIAAPPATAVRARRAGHGGLHRRRRPVDGQRGRLKPRSS